MAVVDLGMAEILRFSAAGDRGGGKRGGPEGTARGVSATRSCDRVDGGGAAPLAVGRAPETDQTLEDEGRSRPSA